MKVSIIIPAYNEEKRIGKTLEEFGKFFQNLKKKKILDYEILVVINNTTDNTPKIVKKYKKKYKEITYMNLRPGGKGFAIIQGFKDALKRNNDLIGFVDADMATHPKDFYELSKHIDDYDGIIASRYVPGAIVKPKQSLNRIIASRIFNFLTRSLLFLNFRDTQCGAKIFRKDAILKIISKLNITKWAFDVNLLYVSKKSGLRIKEIATVWSDKEYSKINLRKSGSQMFFSIVRIRILNSPLKDFVRLYNKLPEKIKKMIRKL